VDKLQADKFTQSGASPAFETLLSLRYFMLMFFVSVLQITQPPDVSHILVHVFQRT